MNKYRKKPVIVDAIQWTGTNKVAVQHFVGRYLDLTPRGLVIPTLEGDHFASVGDYIIKGVKGEFYPCKPDIFYKTYEELYSSTQVDPRCKLTVNAVGFDYIHRGLVLLEARFNDGQHHDQLIEVQKLKEDLADEYLEYLKGANHED